MLPMRRLPFRIDATPRAHDSHRARSPVRPSREPPTSRGEDAPPPLSPRAFDVMRTRGATIAPTYFTRRTSSVFIYDRSSAELPLRGRSLPLCEPGLRLQSLLDHGELGEEVARNRLRVREVVG